MTEIKKGDFVKFIDNNGYNGDVLELGKVYLVAEINSYGLVSVVVEKAEVTTFVNRFEKSK